MKTKQGLETIAQEDSDTEHTTVSEQDGHDEITAEKEGDETRKQGTGESGSPPKELSDRDRRQEQREQRTKDRLAPAFWGSKTSLHFTSQQTE